MAKSRESRSLKFLIVFLFSFLFSSTVYAYPDIKVLDNFWQNRQSEKGQKVIITFLSAAETLPQNFDITWRVARLVYFCGNFGIGYETLTKDKKIEIFRYGYEAADIARKESPERVEGYYWYAVNLGSFGMAKGIFSALSYAEEARDALLKSAELDPAYHWGGPYRVLGRFYQEVPSFISFGDKKKAEEYFNKAIKIAPEFRLNTVDLAVLKKEQGKLELALDLLQTAQKKAKVDGILEENRYLGELEKGIKTLKTDGED